VFSSHILDDVQQVCDTIGILKQGRLVYEGTLDQLVRNAGREAAYTVQVRGDGTSLVELLKSHEWVSGARLESEIITVTASSAAVLERELVRSLARADVPIVAVRPVERSLEDVFLEVTR
jgi:ABC-2 type transport system ATP-binding protein